MTVQNFTGTPYSSIHNDTLADANHFGMLMSWQKQHLAFEKGYEEGLRFQTTGAPITNSVNRIDEDMEKDEIKVEEEKKLPHGIVMQTLVPEAALGGIAGFLGMIGLSAAKHIGSELLEKFKAHFHKVHDVVIPDLTWDHMKWKGYRILQYAVPTIQGALIIWYVVDPNGDARLYLAGFGIIVQYFLNHSSNKTAKSITQAELDALGKVASGQAFNLGLAMSNPEFMAQTGLTTEHLQNMMAKAEARNNVRWYTRLFKCCYKTDVQPLSAMPKKTWCQQLTDCLCCTRICQNIFKKKEFNEGEEGRTGTDGL